MAPVSTIAIAALAAVAVASPTHGKPKPTCKGVAQTANFDDLAGIPGLEFNTIPTPYKGLYYQSFDYTTVLRTGLGTGVLPHSGKNYAGANVVTEVDGTPMLTVFYPNSKVKRFDFSSFYYGCALNLGQGAAAVPNACNIEVTGYQGSDNSVSDAKQVCSQRFQYNPSTAVGTQQQALGKLKKCFKNIQFALVTFTPPGGQTAVGADLALVIDDVKYTTYTCKA